MIRKPRMNARERRTAIVDSAVGLFAERGFRGATTRELAKAVGVTEPVLYQHFATKRALYDAMLEPISRTGPRDAEVPLARFIEAGDDRAFFTQLAELVLDWYLEDPRYIRLLLFSALERHELSDLFYERHVVIFYRMLTDYIQRRMKQRAFRKMDPHLAARAFTGMIAHQGLAGAVLCREGLGAPRKRIIDIMVSIFLEGIRNPRKRAQ